MNIRIFFPIIGIMSIAAIVAGCKQEASTSVEPIVTSHVTYQPKGTITGLVRNRTTETPVEGAVVSVGYDGTVHSTTSDKAGAFSFADVPAGQYQIVNGTSVLSGTYTLTVSLVNYNETQTDAAKKYRDYYYSTATIKFTSLAPGDSLAVSDMVGSVLIQISHLNTAVVGQVVNQNMQPVANAVVSLYDASVVPNVALAQVQTQTDGRYAFTRVDNGLTITLKAVSADGALEGSLPAPITLPANVTADSLRSQVIAERIMIAAADNVSPFVIGVTPEQNADIAPGSMQIVYTFSEPIKQTAYTRTDLAPGHSTILDDITITYLGLKKTAGALTFAAQWNASFTQLTITPQGLIGAARYSASVQPAFSSGKITDMAGRVLMNNAQVTGDFELLSFTTSGGSTVPATPTAARRFVTGLYTNLDFAGGTVGLAWNYDANARSYNIYKSVNEGSFELLAKDVYGVQYADVTGSLVTPSAASNPFTSTSVRYVVRGVSKDLVESASSNIITVVDDVLPVFASSNVAITPYFSSSNNSYIFTLRFSEPLDQASAQLLSNYSFVNTDVVTITKDRADYLGYSSPGVYVVQLQVSTGPLALPAGYTLAISNVSDLAGNKIDPASRFVTAPAQPITTLPANAQTGVSTNPTLSWNSANGALSYHLQISTNLSFSSFVKDTQFIASTGASFNTGFLSGTTYYWRVAGRNSAGDGAFSTALSFTTLGAAPTLNLPVDGAVNVSTTPAFSWTPTIGATSYTVELATDAAFTAKLPPQTTTTNSLTWPTALNAATNYWWRITAVNSTTGASAVSVRFSFRTL